MDQPTAILTPAPLARPVARVEGGRPWRRGDRVRIRPRGRGGAAQVALACRTGVIDALVRDSNGPQEELHFAILIDHGPACESESGWLPVHRFFFSGDELEAL